MYKVRQAAKRIGATRSPGKFGGPWVWDMKSASALKVTIVPDIVPDGDSVGIGDVGSGLTPGVRDHEVETFEFAPGETEAVLADVAGIFDYLAPPRGADVAERRSAVCVRDEGTHDGVVPDPRP
jgi:hypothetical protein